MDSSKAEPHKPSVKSWCPHVRSLSPALCWEEIRRHQSGQECESCQIPGTNLWLCLARGCTYIGCGEQTKDHSTEHAKECLHHLTINLTTLRIWCFGCMCEVFPGHNSPHFNIPEVMPSHALTPSGHTDGSNNSTPQRSTSGAEDSESDIEDENTRPRGLTGLKNLGNTCYLNAAVQALSNCPPLTQFFLDCPGYVRPEKSPMLSKSYMKLVSELWHKKRPSYVVPSGIVNGIKVAHPMFRGYNQQDAQEFLRCFMDQLHEELKYPSVIVDEKDDEEEGDEDDVESGIASPTDADSCSLVSAGGGIGGEGGGGDARKTNAHGRQNSIDSSSSQSECEYETCDSGLSSERASQADNNISGDESSDVNEHTVCLPMSSATISGTEANLLSKDSVSNNINSRLSPNLTYRQNKNRKSSTATSPLRFCADDSVDTVANQKEKKETANLLSKIEKENARQLGIAGYVLQKSESGEYLDALMDVGPAGSTRSKTAPVHKAPAATATLSNQQNPQQGNTNQSQLQHQHQEQFSLNSKTTITTTKSPSGNPGARKKNIHYESVISHIFDGKILSSVQCLYCERVSTTRETFQDLSLPIPSKDYLQVLHSSHPNIPTGGGTIGGPRGGACGDQLGSQSWLTKMFSWMKSWFVGPTINLQDCLSAFFSADELKGDNMYSCEQCKKLRNGLKYSKVLKLPEILCIHLKRFRHEFFSSKINTYISFPLHGLDMKPFLHKDCKSEVTMYDLVAVVCHHGTAGGGHYTAYCLNFYNEQWYEFDDQYVTEVDVSQVKNCEAYVLFYRKRDERMQNVRNKASQLRDANEPSLLQFYVSKQWINRFNTFAEPGPISNTDFLCKHGGVPPNKVGHVEELVEPFEQSVWEFLYSKFGGGPVCNRLYACQVCQQDLDKLRARQKKEMETFIQLNEEFQAVEHPPVIYAMSMAWFKEWESFVRGKTDIPPGPIDNSRITVYRSGQGQLRTTSDYGQLSRDMWNFLLNIYGGGPEIVTHQRSVSSTQPLASSGSSSSPTLKEMAVGSTSTLPRISSAPTTITDSATTNSSSGHVAVAILTSTVASSTSGSSQTDAGSSGLTSSSSSSSETITPSMSPSKQCKLDPTLTSQRASTVSDRGDNTDDNGQTCRMSGLMPPPSVCTMQEVNGIPQPMDVTRL